MVLEGISIKTEVLEAGFVPYMGLTGENFSVMQMIMPEPTLLHMFDNVAKSLGYATLPNTQPGS